MVTASLRHHKFLLRVYNVKTICNMFRCDSISRNAVCRLSVVMNVIGKIGHEIYCID